MAFLGLVSARKHNQMREAFERELEKARENQEATDRELSDRSQSLRDAKETIQKQDVKIAQFEHDAQQRIETIGELRDEVEKAKKDSTPRAGGPVVCEVKETTRGRFSARFFLRGQKETQAYIPPSSAETIRRKIATFVHADDVSYKEKENRE